MSFMPNMTAGSMNVSQISYEWPATFLDVVEWVQHPKKTGVFFHEENVFSLWTMKVMEFDSKKHMAIFLCIDYTIWPGWNHRGVYLLSREQEFKVYLSKGEHLLHYLCFFVFWRALLFAVNGAMKDWVCTCALRRHGSKDPHLIECKFHIKYITLWS